MTLYPALFLLLLAAGATAAVPKPPAHETPLASTARPLVGINYFAGWWHGQGEKWLDPANTSLDWRPLYPERVPLLGEFNSQATMDAEIVAASDHGVDFFQMLYYDDFPAERAPNARLLNRGLTQFMASPNAGRMKFFIEWCNAQPLFGLQSDWDHLVRDVWLPAMKHPSYLRVGGALVFKLINAGSFLKYDCASNHTLAAARWAGLRDAARAAGLGELLIGAGMASTDMTATSWWDGNSGQYNWTGLYAAVGQDDPSWKGKVLPWANESAYVDVNRRKHSLTNAKGPGAHQQVPFLPMVMSGWDPRPWHEPRASYVFPTDAEWEAELIQVKAQLAAGPEGNPQHVPNLGFPLPGGGLQPALNIYAWNEFGEGGVMAPSVGWGYRRLEAILKVFGASEGRRVSGASERGATAGVTSTRRGWRATPPTLCPKTTPGPGEGKCMSPMPTDPNFATICMPGALGHDGGAEPPTNRCPSNNYTGVFACSCCGAPLFDAATKYDAQTGWPAFHSPALMLANNSTVSAACTPPNGYTEVVCATCGAHLGDYFEEDDHYCVDGVCINPPGAHGGCPVGPGHAHHHAHR